MGERVRNIFKIQTGNARGLWHWTQGPGNQGPRGQITRGTRGPEFLQLLYETEMQLQAPCTDVKATGMSLPSVCKSALHNRKTSLKFSAVLSSSSFHHFSTSEDDQGFLIIPRSRHLCLHPQYYYQGSSTTCLGTRLQIAHDLWSKQMYSQSEVEVEVEEKLATTHTVT